MWESSLGDFMREVYTKEDQMQRSLNTLNRSLPEMTAEGRIRSMVCPGFDAMPIVDQLQQFSALTLSREVWRPQSGGGGGGSGRQQATGKRKRGAAAPSFDMSGKCRE